MVQLRGGAYTYCLFLAQYIDFDDQAIIDAIVQKYTENKKLNRKNENTSNFLNYLLKEMPEKSRDACKKLFKQAK